MAFQKKTKKDTSATKGKNILNNPDERKKFKTALSTITQYMQQADDIKEGMKEAVGSIATEYGLESSTVRKMAKTMYLHNYADILEEHRHFEELYETCVNGKLLNDDEMPGEE